MAFNAKSLVSKPTVRLNHRFAGIISSDISPYILRLPTRRRLSSLSAKSESSSVPASFTETIGTPTLSLSLKLTQRRVVFLNVVACTVAISAAWLFFSAIPAILAFKRAAESVEKLMDAVTKELPDTMAALRLSGTEISDLTNELSDLGQEITQGVRSSTRVVRATEERLRTLRNTNTDTTASMQEETDLNNEDSGPVFARTVRRVREGIVEGRTFLATFLSVAQFCRLAINYLASRSERVSKLNRES